MVYSSQNVCVFKVWNNKQLHLKFFHTKKKGLPRLLSIAYFLSTTFDFSIVNFNYFYCANVSNFTFVKHPYTHLPNRIHLG